MASSREPVDRALASWWRDDGRERVARWRGDPDASPRAAVLARHDVLRGPRIRESFEESIERGLLFGRERHAISRWLLRAAVAPTEARAAARGRAIFDAPVAHDSDWHPLRALLGRLQHEPRMRERHAIARSVLPAFQQLEAAHRSADAEREEAAERSLWLQRHVRDSAPEQSPVEEPEASRASGEAGEPTPAGDGPTRGDGATAAQDESEESPPPTGHEAEALLSATDDGWAELAERLAHNARGALEAWPDLLFVLRAQQLDDVFKARGRWPRVAAGLGPMKEPLSRYARAEPAVGAGPEHGLVILEPSRDIRVRVGLERGLGSEREALIAMGRAFAAVTTHPATPESIARPLEGRVGWALGALLAHRLADRNAVGALYALDAKARRAVAETALALEVASLRAGAASQLALLHRDARDFPERARTGAVRALGIDLPEAVACFWARRTRPAADDAASRVPGRYLALRERFDEDWWRNPRTAHWLRAVTATGDDADPSALDEGSTIEDEGPAEAWGPRLRELLS